MVLNDAKKCQPIGSYKRRSYAIITLENNKVIFDN